MTKTTTTSTSDLATVVRQFLGAAALTITLNVEPVPASRPRVSKWGTYYGKTYEKFRKEAKNQLFDHNGEKIEGPINALIEVVVTKPKTTKREYPRGDVDNFAKGPLDSLTSHANVWEDDDQIIGLAVFKRFAEPGEPAAVHVHYAKAGE
jgi:Holliday junction resolvase RusA-like endonuclease